ncbi:type II secretion system protein GspG [Azospira sp. I13]|jgi:general secretion pathway protein G|uniref:type II secretion system major pseudopilin GspG n=1 Tax=Azospira sp. I13 TaxID=1765050 RepID=UPI000D44F0C4|nr:type II secretion system major pseudopilin GspG [Azospira sp. I13]GBG02256.1 type II secretion system protein GspG [Azospira sp. I13]
MSQLSSRRNRGFTLIEIMIVMVIIAMLAALVGPRIQSALGGSKVKATKMQMETLSSMVEAFHLDTGRYPTQQEGLQVLVQNPANAPIKNWRGPYLKKNRIPTDEWGNAFAYEIPSKHGMEFDIYSLGADGKPGGSGDDGDLGNWD